MSLTVFYWVECISYSYVQMQCFTSPRIADTNHDQVRSLSNQIISTQFSAFFTPLIEEKDLHYGYGTVPHANCSSEHLPFHSDSDRYMYTLCLLVFFILCHDYHLGKDEKVSKSVQFSSVLFMHHMMLLM